MNDFLKGRRVLVTGGGGGLGSEIVKVFCKAGALVYALDINQDRLQKLQSEIPTVKTVVADLTKWEEVRKIIRDLGPLEHLVNNAATHIPGSSLTTTELMFDKVFELNVKAPLNLCQVFAEGVIASNIKDATIVNISSAVSERVMLGAGLPYSCSKVALNMMSKHFAAEMAKHGIRVNCVEPTLMNTNLFREMPPEVQKGAVKSVEHAPIPGLMEPEEAANLVLYLSGNTSKMITGTCVPVDGGILLA